MDIDPQTRRQFCARTCSLAAVAALGGAFGAILQGCGGGGSPTSPGGGSADPLPTVNGTVAGNSIVVTIDASSPLSAAGSVALVRSGIGNVLVARTSQDAFSALASICTHQDCAITGHSGQTFVCPCHGSQFDSSGRVLSGPAPTALRQYSAQFAGGLLTITA
jgi:cytochrome b6-f complex iron-sulfur subunit